jgi:hypothetical protein
MAEPRYELADFDPGDGHLHACPDPGGRLGGGCECADHLYAIAHEGSEQLAHSRRLVDALTAELAAAHTSASAYLDAEQRAKDAARG